MPTAVKPDDSGTAATAAAQGSSSSTTAAFLRSLRYYVILAVGCPVPFLKSSVPVIGGRTMIELLGAAATIALGVMLSGTSGRSADYLCAMTILLCMRNNILTLLFGLSFERAIFWHKVMAVTATFAVGIHSTKGANSTGIGIITCMCVAAASYLVRGFWFELFYYVHILCYIATLPMIMMHFGAKYFTYACDVIRLKYKKTTPYRPGQYVFILIPEIHRIEYHPFSFSSCPEDEFVTIHIRELGDWSKKLGDDLRKRLADEKADSVDISVYVEGPYGTHQIDLNNEKYEVMVLISGGIGITPMQSLQKSLIKQVMNGRCMRKVVFIWSVKDRAIIDAMTDDCKHNHDAYLPLSFQPPVDQPPNIRSDVAQHTVGDTETGVFDAVEDPQEICSPFVFFNEFYMTAVRNEAEFDPADIHPAVQKWLKFGRPNLLNIFTAVSNLCKEANIKRVGVCVCGPSQMVDDVKDLCARSHLNPSNKTIRFDCHSEVFDF